MFMKAKILFRLLWNDLFCSLKMVILHMRPNISIKYLILNLDVQKPILVNSWLSLELGSKTI